MLKRIIRRFASPLWITALFALAACILLGSSIGTARAAFVAYSETYGGHIETYDIGVALLEKCQGDDRAREVAYRKLKDDGSDEWDTGSAALLQDRYFLGEDGVLIPGKAYPEEISAANRGNIDAYVRVTVSRYWTDPLGNKVFDTNEKGTSTQGLSPALIDLHLANTDAWLLDEAAGTEERMVFYYNRPLEPGEDLADTPLCDAVTIDRSVLDKVTQTVSADGRTIETVYDYDGWSCRLEAKVDAVQTHSAKDAIRSVWGRDVEIASDGTLRLVSD